MKIICAGFWKTGTKSLAKALRQLGYKVYDYDDQYFNLSELWDKFFDGTVTNEDIRSSLSNIDVVIDGPTIAFWEEIYRAFPEAKVILTSRDEDSWWRSFKVMFDVALPLLKYVFLLLYLTPTGKGFIRTALRVVHLVLGVEGPFCIPAFNVADNPRLYKNLYRKHNSHVIRSVPEENLLVYKPGSGWDPLCKFVGKEVPNVPYPHMNKKGAHFKEEGGPANPKFKRAMIELLILLSVFVCIFACLVYALMT